MVVIPLAPFTTSLLITIVNASVELACLSSMLIFIALSECQRLRNGKAISIRWHCIWVRLVTVIAMIMFVALEIVISVNSDTATKKVINSEDCVTTKLGVRSKDSPPSEIVTFQCMKIQSNKYMFHTGNYSNANGRVQCEKEIVYWYLAQRFLENVPIAGGTTNCEGDTCVVLKSDKKVLLISEPFHKISLNNKSAQATFLPTNLPFDPSDKLEEYAKKMSELYAFPVTDELDIRRLLLLGAEETKCDFSEDSGEVTKISTWIVVVVSAVWATSILLCMFMIFVKKKQVFYDMRNTWDWATKTHSRPGRVSSNHLYIKCGTDRSSLRIYVVDSLEEDDKFQAMEDDAREFGGY